MVNSRRIYLWLIALMTLVTSGHAINDVRRQTDAPLIQEEKNVKIVQTKDTIVGDFSINYKCMELLDDCIQKEVDYSDGTKEMAKYPNGEVCLIIKHKGKTIFSKQIGKADFTPIIPSEELPTHQLVSFHIYEWDKESVTFDANVCLPDTDICYWIGIRVDTTGHVTLSLLEEIWESDSE